MSLVEEYLKRQRAEKAMTPEQSVGQVVSFDVPQRDDTFVGVVRAVAHVEDWRAVLLVDVPTQGEWRVAADECFAWWGDVPASGRADDTLSAAEVERINRRLGSSGKVTFREFL